MPYQSLIIWVMIIVIADDITGAAEIAGAALRYKLDTMLTIGYADVPQSTQVWVIATDTRSVSRADAVNTVNGIIGRLDRKDNILFKKTDSVLRGHVAAELNAMVKGMRYSKALLIPQNPSRGRIIRDGIYYINGEHVDKTQFRHDPEFPITTSEVRNILGVEVNVQALNTDRSCSVDGICVADASSIEDIKTQLHRAGAECLYAGGVDFFSALLEREYPDVVVEKNAKCKINPEKYSIIVCGSTQSKDISDSRFVRLSGTSISVMPDDVFAGKPACCWFESLCRLYGEHNSLAIAIGPKEDGGPECAVRLRHIMSDAVRMLVEAQCPDTMIIEGGATAYSIISSLCWNDFKLKCEYAPGIVGMVHGRTEVVLKPGSYPWGDVL